MGAWRPHCAQWRVMGPPRGSGDAEPVVFDLRRLGEHLVPVQARSRYVLAEDVRQREGVRRRRDSLYVKGTNICSMLEDAGQLGRVALEFLA